jgi:hypothetical protein
MPTALARRRRGPLRVIVVGRRAAKEVSPNAGSWAHGNYECSARICSSRIRHLAAVRSRALKKPLTPDRWDTPTPPNRISRMVPRLRLAYRRYARRMAA